MNELLTVPCWILFTLLKKYIGDLNTGLESRKNVKWYGFGMPFEFPTAQPFENQTGGIHF